MLTHEDEDPLWVGGRIARVDKLVEDEERLAIRSHCQLGRNGDEIVKSLGFHGKPLQQVLLALNRLGNGMLGSNESRGAANRVLNLRHNVAKDDPGNSSGRSSSNPDMVLLNVLDCSLQQLVTVGVVTLLGDKLLGGDGGHSCRRAVKPCLHYTGPVDPIFDRQYLVFPVGETPAVHQVFIALLVFE